VARQQYTVRRAVKKQRAIKSRRKPKAGRPPQNSEARITKLTIRTFASPSASASLMTCVLTGLPGGNGLERVTSARTPDLQRNSSPHTLARIQIA